jgi:hypothetical protein
MYLSTTKQIEKELAIAERLEVRSWGRLSLLLDAIDKSGYWHRDSDSFTEWLGKNNSRFRLKTPMLWRILTAGRFVLKAREGLLSKGIIIPDLKEMSDSISPENIEILSKLERVIPTEMFCAFSGKVFSGNARRSELRDAWQTYRPALGGKTARGRGVSAPQLDQSDPKQYRSFMEAVTLGTLQAAGPQWTGVVSPSVYQFFLHVTPDGYQRSIIGQELFPAVVIVKPKHARTLYHALVFSSSLSCRPLLKYCDYLWIVLHPEQDKRRPRTLRELSDHPKGVGIIEVNRGKVAVVKHAEDIDGAGESRADLISALLIRSLKR